MFPIFLRILLFCTTYGIVCALVDSELSFPDNQTVDDGISLTTTIWRFRKHKQRPRSSCRPGYSGQRCDIIEDLCIATEPCENNGICTNESGNTFSCDCTSGYTGDWCQYMVVLGFKGNGYLELDRSAVSNSTSQTQSGIALIFSSRQPNGLIVWYGQQKGKAFDKNDTRNDFLALAVVDEVPEFRFRLDGQESEIKHRQDRVDLGHRHIAIIRISGNQASFELDGLTEQGKTAPTERKEISLPGHVFLGGAPDMKKFTGDRYSHGFVGCIHTVEPLEDSGPIPIGRRTVSSLNVDQCSAEFDVDAFA